jgi:hypothetical protein
MDNVQMDYLVRYVAHQFDPQVEATINYMYQRSQSAEYIEHKREMERLKQEIIKEVLKQISVTVDTQEALKNIKEVDHAIKELGQYK